ncbi:MAG: phage tail sheath family protein [Solirubrobacteraceae bacterium]
MPSYLTPGVYVEEIPAQSKPIEGVGTSVAAFVGLAPGGPLNTPMRMSNWTQFARTFSDPGDPEAGPFMEGAYLAHALYGFFHNGGTVCWVVRVGANGETKRAVAQLPARTEEGVEAFRAVALEGAAEPIKIELAEEIEPGSAASGGGESPTYRLIITAGPESEEHGGLSLKKGRNYIATKVNAASKLIQIEEEGSATPEQKAPRPGTYELSVPAAVGEVLDAADIEGDVARRTGMGGIAAVDEVTMLCVPDLTNISQNGDDAMVRDLQGKMIAACESSGDRMAFIDPPAGLMPQEVLEWRMNVAGYDSKFAALYYPWIEVMDPIRRRPLMVPPCGHLAGIWARTDSVRGVHKAPANEVVLGANGLGFQVTGPEQGELNRVGVNCIRAFPGRGIRVWGARTLSSDPEWRYINVRRLFNFISESIMQGTQWAVFEPNDQRLWMSLQISATNFLTRVWRSGALFGASPEQAFYVKCDEETNPPDLVEAGQVTCEIGIAPVKPAEFVVFRLTQLQMESGGGGGES